MVIEGRSDKKYWKWNKDNSSYGVKPKYRAKEIWKQEQVENADYVLNMKRQ